MGHYPLLNYVRIVLVKICQLTTSIFHSCPAIAECVLDCWCPSLLEDMATKVDETADLIKRFVMLLHNLVDDICDVLNGILNS